MEDLQRLYPIGIQTFSKIREGNFLYVDKTEYVYRMTHSASSYMFLSRPRRFGKSLLTSTLHSYFSGREELFRGLAMEKLVTDMLLWVVRSSGSRVILPVMVILFSIAFYLFRSYFGFLKVRRAALSHRSGNNSAARNRSWYDRNNSRYKMFYAQERRHTVLLLHRFCHPGCYCNIRPYLLIYDTIRKTGTAWHSPFLRLLS